MNQTPNNIDLSKNGFPSALAKMIAGIHCAKCGWVEPISETKGPARKLYYCEIHEPGPFKGTKGWLCSSSGFTDDCLFQEMQQFKDIRIVNPVAGAPTWYIDPNVTRPALPLPYNG